MSKLSVALHGIGFGKKLMALQGFGKTDLEEEDPDLDGGIVFRSVLDVPRKKRERRRDTDDDAIFMFLLG